MNKESSKSDDKIVVQPKTPNVNASTEHSSQIRSDRKRAAGKFGKVDWLGVLKYVSLGMAITMFLVIVKVGVEHTVFGEIVEKRTYTLFATILPKFRPEGAGVIVVDIGHLQGGMEDTSTGQLKATPRRELTKILEALVLLRPSAIGVDIDFSPTPTGWVDDNDPIFLRRCLALGKNTPILLGVFRSLREPSDAWLGLPELSSMATGLWLPRVGLLRTPVWTQASGTKDKLPSLGAALAAKHLGLNEEQGPDSVWLQRFRERRAHRTTRADGLLIGEVLTDYSAVTQMSREAIRITSAEQLPRYRSRIEGRIVVLGVVDQATDHFPVPGEERNVPGVIIHAANANTMANEPIWELSHGLRLTLDLILSAALLVAALALRRKTRSKAHANMEQSEKKALRWLIVGTFVAGALAVVMFRVLWLDFLLVALSLVAHPRIAVLLHRLSTQ